MHPADHEKKLIYVIDSDHGNPRPFNLRKAKLYHRPEDIVFSFMSDLLFPFSYFRSPDGTSDTFATEILSATDPPANSAEMDQAKKLK